MRKVGLVAVSVALGGAACGGGSLPSEAARSPGNPSNPAGDATPPSPAPDAGLNDLSAGPVRPGPDAAGLAELQWVEVTPSADLGVAGLQIVSASAAATDDLYFASNSASVIRWNHGQWSFELTAPSSPWAPSHVSAGGPDDVWAVLAGVLYHRTSSGWSVDDSWQTATTAPASPTSVPATVGPIRAVGPGNIWMVVRSDPAGTLLRRQGGAWSAFAVQPVPSPPVSYEFADLWVDCRGGVWLGGAIDDDTGPTETPALLFHFDGATWATFGVGLWGVAALWGDGARGLWMAIPEGQGLSTLALFDTIHGQAVYSQIGAWPSNGAEVHSLWGRAPDDIWAAGDDVGHWDGQSWQRATGVPDGARPAVNTGSGQTIVVGDAGSVWLVSQGPRFFRLGPPL